MYDVWYVIYARYNVGFDASIIQVLIQQTKQGFGLWIQPIITKFLIFLVCSTTFRSKLKTVEIMVNAKHLATFVLGAAAGVALHKYLQTEEGEKMFEELKTKAGDLKTEAEGALDKMPEYFEQLKTQGSDAL